MKVPSPKGGVGAVVPKGGVAAPRKKAHCYSSVAVVYKTRRPLWGQNTSLRVPHVAPTLGTNLLTGCTQRGAHFGNNFSSGIPCTVKSYKVLGFYLEGT